VCRVGTSGCYASAPIEEIFSHGADGNLAETAAYDIYAHATLYDCPPCDSNGDTDVDAVQRRGRHRKVYIFACPSGTEGARRVVRRCHDQLVSTSRIEPLWHFGLTHNGAGLKCRDKLLSVPRIKSLWHPEETPGRPIGRKSINALCLLIA
jgi:hypothetical protein